jgi:hypothetical protein
MRKTFFALKLISAVPMNYQVLLENDLPVQKLGHGV